MSASLTKSRLASVRTVPIGRNFLPSLDSSVVAENSTHEQNLPDGEDYSAQSASLSARLRILGWSGILFALLQSACAAVIAISGIRIPMMLFALIGSLINLFVIWKIRSLRSKPASQWRQTPITAKKLNSERLQIALSILTLVLLAAEWVTHPLIHRVP
jgi:hypothetical protein